MVFTMLYGLLRYFQEVLARPHHPCCWALRGVQRATGFLASKDAHQVTLRIRTTGARNI